jgi:hypothetical protein
MGLAGDMVKFLAKTVWGKAQRSETVLKILKKLNIDQLSADVDSVYAHALV